MNAQIRTFRLGLALLIVACVPSAFAQSVANGEALYTANCASCHGFPNYPLVQRATLSNDLKNAINGGVPTMQTPALTALTQQNLNDIILYISTLVNPVAYNYQGLWWVPNGAENGWGINFAHQGNQIFATWYTYDTNGNPWWTTMLATRASANSNVYTGQVYSESGPPFNNFKGSGTPTSVGVGTLTFTDKDNGTFAYAMNAGGANVQQVKTITRFLLTSATPQPVCTYVTSPNLNAATNYQDIWWVPNGTESGWGINFAHQATLIYATWYTYATNNTPMWLSALATQQPDGSFTGPLMQNSGPRYDIYDKTAVKPPVTVGTAKFVFTNGNSAIMSYTVNGGGLPATSQSKSLTRFLFGANAATLCR